MQLNTGDRVYGHVRRYLPKHALVHGRMDVGRRASRAMILLTRHTAGDKFFYAVLRYVLQRYKNEYFSSSRVFISFQNSNSI